MPPSSSLANMKMTSNSIVVIGGSVIDFTSYAPRIPKPGETVVGTEFVANFGGKGANQCVAAAKLGGETAFISRVGDDPWGPKFLEHLNKLEVNTDYVKTTEYASTGISQIIVSDSGENQIVYVAGANNIVNTNDIDEAREILNNAAVLLVQLETSEEVALRAIQLCGGISILNAAPVPAEYNDQLLTLPTIFCVNETEASVFTGGSPITNLREAEDSALNLLSRGCNSVLITLGKQGAFYLDKNEKFHVTCPCVKCIDSTGAGDAFLGALAYLLANRKNISMREAVEKACVAASDSVTRPGTQMSFPGSDILL